MRPVDYRAWDTTERKMIYDFSNFAGWQARHEMEDLWKHDRYIKMQFTGLIDNSTPPKKIYEGDIVKYPEYYFGDSRMPAGKEVIEWEGNGFNELLWFGYGNYPAWVKVIGNIFENPELMEE